MMADVARRTPAGVLRAALCSTVFLLAIPAAQAQFSYDVPYVPTPPVVVEEMLRLAEVTAEDFVIDLGSGDGRVVIAAVSKFGARGIGVDLDPDRILESDYNASVAGVSDRVAFHRADLFKFEIHRASVITMYLLPSVNIRLRPRLLAELQPGTRIVSHDFDMEDWKPDAKSTVRKNVFLWIVPARVEGIWRLAQGELILQQSYQKVTGVLRADGVSRPIVDGRLRGDEIAFSVEGKSYAGRVTGESMSGEVKGGATWTASRLSR